LRGAAGLCQIHALNQNPGVAMRLIEVIRLIALAAILLFSPLPARAADPDMAELDRSLTLANKGDLSGALAITEAVLAHAPDNENALYRSALFNFHMNNVEAARGRLERLVKLSGSYFSAWELMVQVAQSQGDLARRNEAVKRLKIAIETAIDPAIRQKSDFVRDWIRIGDQYVAAVDYFARGGSDFTRYQFAFGDPHLSPDKGLLLRTDAVTTANWSETALMPQDKQLFHLDLVDAKPEGGENVAVYQYYVDEPDYDTVRAKVMQILRGEAQPLSGSPGSLQGIMKP
jgi:tetratricopeptide (TPR) repeat protein